MLSIIKKNDKKNYQHTSESQSEIWNLIYTAKANKKIEYEIVSNDIVYHVI